jgi:hypothetical protein
LLLLFCPLTKNNRQERSIVTRYLIQKMIEFQKNKKISVSI